MRKWVFVGLVVLSSFAVGCASSGRFSAITLANTLQLHEEKELIAPRVQRFPTENILPYLKPLGDVLKQRGFKLYVVDNLTLALISIGVPLPPGAEVWGYNNGKNSIFLDSDMSVDEAFSTLLHEYGHSLQPEELNATEEAQVYAEAFAYVVCQEFGFDTTNATFPYLVDFEKRQEILRHYAERIDAQAADMIKALRAAKGK